MTIWAGYVCWVNAPVNRADAFGLPIHYEITQSLNFLGPLTLYWLGWGHFYADTQFFSYSTQHFDNCQFQGATGYIHKLYSELSQERTWGDDAGVKFGKILHAAQDFYAHSNWVEMGRRDLLDPSRTTNWKILPKMDFSTHGIFVIQGGNNDIPAGFTLSLDPNTKQVKVTTSGGAVYPGLISGTTSYQLGKCPDPSLGHGFFGGPGLNKDDSDRGGGYIMARNLAQEQTLNEWCRLVNLVKYAQGDPGVKKLFDSWVIDKAAAEKACVLVANIAPEPTPTTPIEPSTQPPTTPTPTEPTPAPIPTEPTPTEPTCPDGQILVDGECQEPPTEPTCPDGQVLEDGECVDPTDITCPDGQILVDGECQEPPEEPPEDGGGGDDGDNGDGGDDGEVIIED